MQQSSAAGAALLLLAATATSQALDELVERQRAAVASGLFRVLGEPVRGHANYAMSVDVSPDGTRCVSAGWDGRAKIWNLRDGGAPLELRGHDGILNFACFARGGKVVVTAGQDETLRVFDATTGAELRKVEPGAIHHAGAVSPDGNRLASSDQRADEVEIRDVEDLEVVQRVPFAGSMQTEYAWSPDGRYLVVGGSFEAKVVVWDTTEQKVVSTLSVPRRVGSIAVRKDGRALAVGGYDAVGTFPFPETGDEPSDYVTGIGSAVRGVMWRDPRTLVFGDDEGGIRALDLDGPELVWSVVEHRDTVQDLAASPDGTFVASASHDQTVRFWSTADGAERFQVAGNRDMVQAIAWSRDGARLVAGDYGNQVAVHDAATGAVLVSAPAHAWSVVAVGFAADGTPLSAGQDDVIVRHAADAAERIPLQSEDELPMMITGAFDGAGHYAGAFEDGVVRLYTVADGAEATAIPAHEGPVHDLAWSADRKVLATVGSDGAVRTWRADGTAVATVAEDLELENEVCFAGARVVTGDAGGTLRIFPADGGEPQVVDVRLGEEDEAIQDVCASADGTVIAAVTAFRVSLWSAADGTSLGASGDYLGVPLCVAFAPDGARLAVGMVDSSVLVFDVAKLRGE